MLTSGQPLSSHRRWVRARRQGGLLEGARHLLGTLRARPHGGDGGSHRQSPWNLGVRKWHRATELRDGFLDGNDRGEEGGRLQHTVGSIRSKTERLAVARPVHELL